MNPAAGIDNSRAPQPLPVPESPPFGITVAPREPGLI